MFWFLFSFAHSEIKFTKLDRLLPFKEERSDQNPTFNVSSIGTTCIDWQNLNPELIKVTPIKNGYCSLGATIEVISTGIERKVAKVFASEKNGNTKVPLTFYINTVKSLSIKSSTKSLFVDTQPITFQLIGYDEHNNTFDTLNGLTTLFRPDLSHLTVVSKNNSEASITLRGKQIGETYLGGELKNVQTSIKLFVIDPIGLFPGPVLHVPIHHTIPIKLCSIRGQTNSKSNECLKEIDAQDYDKYEVSEISGNYGILDINLEERRITTNKYGSVTIRVVDKSASDNIAILQVHVEKPVRAENTTHYILKGTDPDFNPIFYCQHQKMDIFYKLSTEIVSGDWKEVGEHTVKFKYYDFTYIEKVYVYDPLYADPANLILPLQYTMELPVFGGSRIFNISTSMPTKSLLGTNLNLNSQIISFNDKNNPLSIKTSKEGEVDITIIDTKLPNQIAKIHILVSDIYAATVSVTHSEIFPGQTTDVECNYYAQDNQNFSVEIPYTIHVGNSSVLSNNDKSQTRTFNGANIGSTTLYCSNIYSTKLTYKQRVDVLQQPILTVDGLAAPLSNIVLNIEGGPNKWPKEIQVGKQRNPNEEEDDGRKIEIQCSNFKVKIVNYTIFSIDQDVEYDGMCNASLYNIPSRYNPTPIVTTGEFHLTINHVKTFTLHTVDTLPKENHVNDNICLTPKYILYPFQTHTIVEPRFKVPVNNLVQFYVVARNEKGQYIKYHDNIASAITFSEEYAGSKLQKNSGLPFNTDLFFRKFTSDEIEAHVSFTLIDNYARENKEIDYTIQTYYPFYFEKNSFKFYSHRNGIRNINIKNGTGVFSLVESEKKLGAFDRSDVFVPNDYSKGIHNYHIYDLCAYSQPKSIEVEFMEIARIDIIAPSAVPAETEFRFELDLYTEKNESIPYEFVESIETPKVNKESVQIKENVNLFTYSIVSYKGPTMTLIAQIGNVKAEKVIQIIPPVVISPQKIIMLPGQSAELTVITGPEEISLGRHDSSIISLSGRTVTAIKPGVTKILATTMESFNIKPYEVIVIVPTPLSLEIDTSSQNLVEGGHLALDLSVKTNYGSFICTEAQWNIPGNFAYEIERSHHVLINLTSSGSLIIEAEAYGLKQSFDYSVEPKLILPQTLILAPNTQYQFELPHSYPRLSYRSLSTDTTKLTVSNQGLIKTFSAFDVTEYVVVETERQKAVVVVQIEKPYQIIVRTTDTNSTSQNELSAILINKNGLPFSSINGIKFEATPQTQTNPATHINTMIKTNKFSQNVCKFKVNYKPADSPQDGLEHDENNLEVARITNAFANITVTASNNAFTISQKVILHNEQLIKPSMPNILLGTTLQMTTTELSPVWSTSSAAVATITTKGFLHAKKLGSATIENGKNGKTNLTVVKIENLEIESISKNTVRVKPIMNIETLDYNLVIKPNDMDLRCSISSGSITPIVNSSGLFCIYNLPLSAKLSTKQESFNVLAELNSRSLKLHTSANIRLNSNGRFLIPDMYKVKLSPGKTEETILLQNINQLTRTDNSSIVAQNITNYGNITIEKGIPAGISASLDQKARSLFIRISDASKLIQNENIIINLKESNENVRVQLEYESFGTTVVQEKVRTPIKRVLFAICVVICIMSIYVILMQIGFA